MPDKPLQNLFLDIEAQKKRFLDTFLRLRNDYSEEIPHGVNLQELLHNEDKLSSYKCSKFFFAKVFQGASMLINIKIVTDVEVIAHCEEFEKFVEKLKVERFTNISSLATKEDIDKANEFLDFIMGELQKS